MYDEIQVQPADQARQAAQLSFLFINNHALYLIRLLHTDNRLRRARGAGREVRGGVTKSEKFFFAFLDELDHSNHFLKCPSKSLTFSLSPPPPPPPLDEV